MKKVLKALIKEGELIKSLEHKKEKISKDGYSSYTVRDTLIKQQEHINEILGKKYNDIFGSTLSESQKANLQKNVIRFISGADNDNQVNIPPQLPEDEKCMRLSDYIRSQVPAMDSAQEEQFDKHIKSIYEFSSDYSAINEQIKRTNQYNTPSGNYAYYNGWLIIIFSGWLLAVLISFIAAFVRE